LIGTDTIAQGRAEEALQKAGALQRAISNSVHFSSIATDAKGVIQIFNVGAEAMSGYSAAEVVNKMTPADISDPQEIINRAAALSREFETSISPGVEALVFKASRSIEDIYELTYVRKDGSRFPAMVSVTALRDPEGAIIGFLLIGTDNTLRKRGEEALRDSEERFRTMANAIPQLAQIARADGFIVWYNQRWYDYTGSTAAQMEGWGWQSVHDPVVLPAVMVQWQAAIATGQPFQMEFPLRGADGKYRQFLTRAEPVKNAAGQVMQWIATNTDITERELATDQFRLALEAAPTGMLMIDDAGTIVLVNAQIETVFGYGRAELLGKRLEMLLPERFRAHHPGLRQEFSLDPKTRIMGGGRELYGLRKDGSEVPIEVGLNPLRISEDFFVLSSITDITERRRANDAQQRMTALVQSTSDAIVTEDLQGAIRSWNLAAESLLGYAAKEIIGQPGTRLIPVGRQEEETGILLRVEQGHKVTPLETVRLRKNGSLVAVSLTISPILGQTGGIVGTAKIMRDITRDRVVADELRSVNTELELRIKTRTAELRERESLLQEIHHRVKNNLQVISSLINTQIHGLKDESSRRALSDCQSRVMTMAKIHEMLYQSDDYARVPFAKYAKDLTTRILSASGTSPGKITLRFELTEVSLPVDQAIPCGLILNELVANSLKHAFPNAAHGTICVQLRLVRKDSVILCVSDDGIGISPGLDLEHRSSLGVQLVMTLVEQLEGRLEVVRQPGSTFKITFPLEFAT
jgi:PAS domain S-box-containing protein